MEREIKREGERWREMERDGERELCCAVLLAVLRLGMLI